MWASSVVRFRCRLREIQRKERRTKSATQRRSPLWRCAIASASESGRLSRRGRAPRSEISGVDLRGRWRQIGLVASSNGTIVCPNFKQWDPENALPYFMRCGKSTSTRYDQQQNFLGQGQEKSAPWREGLASHFNPQSSTTMSIARGVGSTCPSRVTTMTRIRPHHGQLQVAMAFPAMALVCLLLRADRFSNAARSLEVARTIQSRV